MWKGRCSGELSGLPAVGDRFGESNVFALVDARGVEADTTEGSGGEIFTGKGKSGPLFFFLCGKRKKVVVVEMV